MNELKTRILDDIYSRCGGEASNMNLTDRITYKSIMLEFKAELDNFYNSNYPIISYWANIDIEKEIEVAKEPDFIKLERLFKDKCKCKSFH